MKALNNNLTDKSFDLAGFIATPLRLVVGWTYFSAFWRRMILENKLDPEGLGYVGEKFNHFLPNALFVKPMIEWLVSNPGILENFLIVFTIIEAIVGLFIMLGLFTRSMSVGVIGLALGILFGAGWLGTTCLDEWQIGVLGAAAGFVVLFAGGGPLSLDALLLNKNPKLQNNKWFVFSSSGALDAWVSRTRLYFTIGIFSLAMLFLTLFTNQSFHGGVWGKLHNLSVRPHVVISNVKPAPDNIEFTLFRDQGADVYGSFTIAIRIKSADGEVLHELAGQELAKLPKASIDNFYVSKIKPGKHSLILPLGAKAKVSIPLAAKLKPGTYSIELEDISGVVWVKQFNF